MSRSWEAAAEVAWARRLLSMAALLLPLGAATAVYAQFLGHWFLTDDFLWLEAASSDDLSAFIRGAFEFPRGPTPYWRPLIDGYFFAMYRVFGLEATAYHVANLLVHGANAALTALIVRRLVRSWLAGTLAGLFFAVTPAYGTTVVWASAATELHATLLGLSSILLFLFWQQRPRPTMLAASVLCFAGALLAKETSVAVPVLAGALAVVARWPSDRAAVRRLALGLCPFVVLVAAYGALQFSQVYQASATTNYELSWDAVPRLFERLRWVAVPLSSFEGSWVEPAQWGAMVGALALSCATALLRRWALPALFAATVVALLPTSFLTTTFAPRWVYLASVFWSAFLAVALAPALAWLAARHPLAGAAAGAAVLALLGYLFVPATVDAQRWVPGQATQMHDMRVAMDAACTPPTILGSRVITLPLPVVDPGYAVPSMVRMLYPNATVARARPGMEPPDAGDCLLQYRDGQYAALPGDDPAAARHWIFQPPVPCVDAVPWELAGFAAGQTVSVQGPLVGVRVGASRNDTLLDVGQEGKLLVVIAGPDPQETWGIFDNVQRGSIVCVTGTVRGLRGLPVVVLDDPAAITFEEPPGARPPDG